MKSTIPLASAKFARNRLLAAVLLLTLPAAAVNEPTSPVPPKDDECKPSDPSNGSFNWSLNLGHARYSKPASLRTLGQIGSENNGNLPQLSDLISRSFSPDPLQTNSIVIQIAQNQISTETFDPACLFVESEASFELLTKVPQPGAAAHVHQVLTEDRFTLVDRLPSPESGWRLRVWKRNAADLVKSGDYYVTTNFEAATPLTDVTVKQPNGVTSGNTLLFFRKDATGIAGTHSVTEETTQTVDAQNKPVTLISKLFSGEGTAGPLLSQENLIYSQRGSKLWDYTITRSVSTASVDAAGTIGSLVLTAKSQEDYDDYSMASSPGGGEIGMKRLISKIDAFDLPGQSPQVTTHTYSLSLGGRLVSTLNPDGSWYYNDYAIATTSPLAVVTSYSGWKDLPITARASARKTVTTTTATETIEETFIGSQLIAKNKMTIVPGPTENITTQQKWDGSAWHITTTAYYGDTLTDTTKGRIKWIETSDGTASTYSYEIINGNLVATIRAGAGSRVGITAGTEVVTHYGLGNMAISSITKDIASNLITEQWDTDLTYNGGFDAMGRPIKRIYNGDVNDYDITQYACCGLEFTRDRMAATTQYFRDGLKRVYKMESKTSAVSPTISNFTTINGLTTTRSRSIGGQSLFLGAESRSIDSLSKTTTEPSKKSTLTADRPITTSVTVHSATGDVTTSTQVDGSTIIEASYLDGKKKSVSGTAVPDRSYDYVTHSENGGGIASITTASGVVSSEFKDMLDRTYKSISGANGISLWTYNSPTAALGSRGQFATATDGDNVTITYVYNAKGERTTTSRTVPLASGSATQVTISTRDVVANVLLHGNNLGICQRQTDTIASTGIAAVTTSESFVAINGLASGSLSFGRQTLSLTTRPDPVTGIATRTTTLPDATKEMQVSTHGLVTAVQKLTTTGSLVTATSYLYDPLRRLASSTDARTGTTSLSNLTESGQPLTLTTPANHVTTSAFDVMGREISTTLPDGTLKFTAYHPTGRVKVTWGSQTYPTWNIYDEQNRQTQLHTWKVAPTLNPAAIPANPPAGSEVTTWIYGATTGRLDRKQYADAKGTNYTYTAAGRLASRVWARGVTTSYTYNQGFLTLTDYSDTTPDVAITYEPLGRQSTVTQMNQSQTSYMYNPLTLKLSSENVKYDIDNNGSYEFERALTRLQDSLLREIQPNVMKTASTGAELITRYTYSATDGRLSTVSSPVLGTFTYNYLPNSNLISNIAANNGAIHTAINLWEPNRDVLDVKQNKVGTTVISSFDYAVNAIGQRSGVSQSGSAFPTLPSWAWGYDSLGQVTTADSNIATSDRAYEYDTIGNRKKSVDTLVLPVANNYTANALNQYFSQQNPGSASASSPVYDFDGNASSYPLPAAPSSNSTLTWDAENRLIASTVASVTTRYQYDAQSRRIAKIAGTAATDAANLYLYDGWNCFAEYSRSVGVSPTISLAKTQLWGMDLSGTMQGAGGVGGLLAVKPTGTSSRYPTYDGNGNVSEYLTATGTIAAHFEYDPFGNTVVNTDTSNLFNYRFSTKPRDAETGLYYYGYRYYDPLTGRWPSRDPIGEKQGGVNLYGFVGNNGICWIDYLGLEEACCGEVKYDPSTKCCENLAVVDKIGEGDTKVCPEEYKRQAAEKNKIIKESGVPWTKIREEFGNTLDERFPAAATSSAFKKASNIMKYAEETVLSNALQGAAGGMAAGTAAAKIIWAASYFN